MDIFRIIAVGLITAITAMIIKQIKPEYYIVIVLAGGIIMLFMLVDGLKILFDYFAALISKSTISYELFASILKILGIGYLAEFASSICIDSGNQSIADKIILGGKVIILCLSLPIITSLLDTIISLLP